jgi:hypothetical protein
MKAKLVEDIGYRVLSGFLLKIKQKSYNNCKISVTKNFSRFSVTSNLAVYTLNIKYK